MDDNLSLLLKLLLNESYMTIRFAYFYDKHRNAHQGLMIGAMLNYLNGVKKTSHFLRKIGQNMQLPSVDTGDQFSWNQIALDDRVFKMMLVFLTKKELSRQLSHQTNSLAKLLDQLFPMHLYNLGYMKFLNDPTSNQDAKLQKLIKNIKFEEMREYIRNFYQALNQAQPFLQSLKDSEIDGLVQKNLESTEMKRLK